MLRFGRADDVIIIVGQARVLADSSEGRLPQSLIHVDNGPCAGAKSDEASAMLASRLPVLSTRKQGRW